MSRNPRSLMTTAALSLMIVAAHRSAADQAQDIIAATGIQAGLAVHVGTTDGLLEAGLTNGGKMLVHGLALTTAARDQARSAFASQGLYPIASVERARSLAQLPYGDNLVNLLVADLDALGPSGLTEQEITRVVAPFGAAYLKKGGAWSKATKTLPSSMDEWTHWDHGPDGNAVSRDLVARPPVNFRWIADGWKFVGMRQISPTHFRIAGGRAFYTEKTDPNSEGTTLNYFKGRDAFNGVALWSRDDFIDASWQDHACLIAMGNRLYTFDNNKHNGHYVALDATTGALVKEYDKGLLLSDGTPFTLIFGNNLLMAVGSRMVILDVNTGELKSSYTSPNGQLLYPCVAADLSRAFFVVADNAGGFRLRWNCAEGQKSVICVDYSGAVGTVKWECTGVAGKQFGQLIYDNGYLAVFGSSSGGPGVLGCLSATDGALLWMKDQATEGTDTYHAVVWQNNIFGWGYGGLEAWSLVTGEKSWARDDFINQRCNRLTATVNYLSYGFVAYRDKELGLTFSSVTRSQCAAGVHFAYGMEYFTPISCGCLGNPLSGFLALSAEGNSDPLPDDTRLENAQSYGAGTIGGVRPPIATGPIVADWTVSDFFKSATTTPVTYQDLSITGYVHENKVAASRGGTAVWTFVTGGRVTGDPVMYADKCIFGSHDGWVYCVNAADGSLVWRFMAAPLEKKVVAYSQLESAWPVYGLQLAGSKVHFSAGRHSLTDHGIFIYSVDAATGSLECKRRIYMVQETIDSSDFVQNSTFNLTDRGVLNTPAGFSIDCANPQDSVFKNTRPTSKYGKYEFKVPPILYDPKTPSTIGVRAHESLPDRRLGPLGLVVRGFQGSLLLIEVVSPGPYRASLCDPSGRQVFTTNGSQGQTIGLPREKLHKGVYVLRVRERSGSRSETAVTIPIR